MTPELKKAIEMEQSYLKEIQKKPYHDKRELSVEEGVDAFWTWGKFAGSFVDYCHAHPQIAKEAREILNNIDRRIEEVKQQGERKIGANAQLKRAKREHALLEAKTKKKKNLWLGLGLLLTALITVVVYGIGEWALELYLNGIWDDSGYLAYAARGLFLLVPLVYLIICSTAFGRMNSVLEGLRAQCDAIYEQLRITVDADCFFDIEKLEESKESYENVIRAVHANGDVALYRRSSLD